VAGVELASRIYRHHDKGVTFEEKVHDGSPIHPGDVVFMARGDARSLLATERLILNSMQRMSGIATTTRRLSDKLKGTRARLMDTRKTTPNFRLMEKWAVQIGGGLNHRLGLFDKIMIKDNHVDLAGGVAAALRKAISYRSTTNKSLEIEVETRNLEEVEEALLAGGADIILLDNMTISTLKRAVELIGGRSRTEASGGITESNLREIAETGVDYISMGALTHSVRSLDLSLKVVGGVGGFAGCD
jgi:nicotinate-nucleotide pyrophosphorylase (carboxylating)